MLQPEKKQPRHHDFKKGVPIKTVQSRQVFIYFLWNIPVGSRTHLVNGIFLFIK